MKSKKTILLILLMMVSGIPIVKAVTPQSQTVKITDTHDDMFITEVGIGIDSSLVTILDPNMDIRAFLVFREIKVDFWEPLKNATLRLHTSNTLDFDADSSISIYGIKLSDLQVEGWLLPSTVLSLGFTDAVTNYNTSEFYGGQWHEIDVTDIVEELIRNPNWDGAGTSGTEDGDAIGFHILGDEGSDKRYFYDLSVGNGLEAQLVIHWNHKATPPAEGITFIKIHGENYSIWGIFEYGLPELFYTDSLTLDFHNSTTGINGRVEWTGGGFDVQSSGAMEFIARLDPWVFLVGDNGSHVVYYSDDEFSPGSIRSSEANHQYADLLSYEGNKGGIVLDAKDNQTLHVVWTSPTPWENAVYNVIYTNFTVLENGSLNWSPSYENITIDSDPKLDPDIYSSRDGSLHIAWTGKNGTAEYQAMYRRRYANGTWADAVRVSEGDAQDASEIDVVAHEITGDALLTWTYIAAPNTIRWDIVFGDNNTDGPDREIPGRWVSVVNDRENNVAHMAYCEPGAGGNPSVDYRYKSIDNSSSWSATQNVSPDAQKHFYPTISLNELNDTLVAIWWNDWNAQTAYNYWQIGSAPVASKEPISIPELKYPSVTDYHEGQVIWLAYLIYDENGTNVHNSTSLGEAEDWIEINYPDPEDPNPGGQWEETGPFTRFKTRLYILLMGFGLLFGPLVYFAIRRPSGYEFVIGLFIMLVGYSFLMAAAGI